MAVNNFAFFQGCWHWIGWHVFGERVWYWS